METKIAQNIAQPGSASQSVALAAELDQDRVEQALALQDPFPDQRDHDRRQEHGKEEHARARSRAPRISRLSTSAVTRDTSTSAATCATTKKAVLCTARQKASCRQVSGAR